MSTVSSAAKSPAPASAVAPTPAPSVSQPVAASSSSSSSFVAPTPAARPLAANNARIPMDDHEFPEFLASLSRGLMKDADQIRKIKAAASANFFTCAQAIAMAQVVKGHPGEAIITLFPALTDADVDANFVSVLLSLKWMEERTEVCDALKLDKSRFAAAFKK